MPCWILLLGALLSAALLPVCAPFIQSVSQPDLRVRVLRLVYVIALKLLLLFLCGTTFLILLTEKLDHNYYSSTVAHVITPLVVLFGCLVVISPIFNQISSDYQFYLSTTVLQRLDRPRPGARTGSRGLGGILNANDSIANGAVRVEIEVYQVTSRSFHPVLYVLFCTSCSIHPILYTWFIHLSRYILFYATCFIQHVLYSMFYTSCSIHPVSGVLWMCVTSRLLYLLCFVPSIYLNPHQLFHLSSPLSQFGSFCHMLSAVRCSAANVVQFVYGR